MICFKFILHHHNNLNYKTGHEEIHSMIRTHGTVTTQVQFQHHRDGLRLAEESEGTETIQSSPRCLELSTCQVPWKMWSTSSVQPGHCEACGSILLSATTYRGSSSSQRTEPACRSKPQHRGGHCSQHTHRTPAATCCFKGPEWLWVQTSLLS